MLQLQSVYTEAWQRLEQEIDRYTRRIEAGDPALPGLLHRQRAAQDAQEAIQRELDRLDALVANTTRRMQANAVAGAHQGVTEMVAAQNARIAANLRMPNLRAVESLIGFASDGSPLLDVLASASGGRAEEMTALLARNVALGINPMVTALQMRDQFQTAQIRARTIARTETVRAFREASHLSMEANNDVIDGWIWLSALSARTCAACFAMHGTFHPISERLQDHPNGRCVAAPHVRDTPLPPVNGEARFRQLTEAQQRATLGPARYQAWQDGRVGFTDLVGVRRSPRWGDSIHVRSLDAALSGASPIVNVVERAVVSEVAGAADRSPVPILTEVVGALASGEWRPEREDATLVGTIGDAAWAEIQDRTSVRQVYAIPRTWGHVSGSHEGQFDLGVAQSLVPNILGDPDAIYRASKDVSLRFAGRFDDSHSLIATIKALPEAGELWLESMYVTGNKRLLRPSWANTLIYRRPEES